MGLLIDAVRAALLFSSSRSHLVKGEYEKAAEEIELSKKFFGSRIDRSTLFYVYIRAGQIFLKNGQLVKSVENTLQAIYSINRNKYLNDVDRGYLLDFCDVLLSDANGGGQKISYRVHPDDYGKVTKRYLREYRFVLNSKDTAFDSVRESREHDT
jgi:hypothetical protein